MIYRLIQYLLITSLLTSCAFAAQTVNLMPVPRVQLFNNSGAVLNAGLVYTCVTGSSCPGTPLATYTDATGMTMNANPVVLDSAGRASIWLTAGSTYRIVVKTSAGVTISTTDGIVGVGGGSGSDLWTETGAGTGVYPTTTTQDVIVGGSNLPSTFGAGGGVLGTVAGGIHVFSGTTANENDLHIRSTGGAITFDERAFGTASRVPMIFRVGGGNSLALNVDGGTQYYGKTAVSGVAGAGVLYYDSTLNKFRCSQNGAAMSDCLAGGTAAVGGWTATGATVYVTNTTADMYAGFTTSDSTSTIVGAESITVASTSANGAIVSLYAASGGTVVSMDTGNTGSGTTRPWTLTVDDAEALRVFTNRRFGVNQATDNGYQMQVGGSTAVNSLSINSGATSYGTITTGGGNDIRMCSQAGPCSTWLSVGATSGIVSLLSTAASAALIIDSTTATSILQMKANTTDNVGTIAANTTEIDLCSAAGPCASGFGVFATYGTVFGTDVNPLHVITGGAVDSGIAFYTSTSSLAGTIYANPSEIGFSSAAGPGNSGVGVLTDMVRLYANGGGEIDFLGGIAGAPASPGAATFYMYVDTADGNRLKVKGASGTVTLIALP